MTQQENAPAWQAAEKRDWVAYYDRVKDGEPRATLMLALDKFDSQTQAEPDRDGACSRSGRLAVDLGCGDGRDTAELLRRGWQVIASDEHPEGLRRLRERTDADMQAAMTEGRLEIHQSGFGDAPIPACDLVNASFALPFCKPGEFADLWARIVGAIKPGGRFAGQLFGDRDSWSTIEDRTHFTRDEAIALFDGFILEQFNEDEHEGEDAQSNQKHWHVFHVVACKRSETRA